MSESDDARCADCREKGLWEDEQKDAERLCAALIAAHEALEHLDTVITGIWFSDGHNGPGAGFLRAALMTINDEVDEPLHHLCERLDYYRQNLPLPRRNP